MHYLICTVSDCDLPEGITHVIVEQTDGPPLLVIGETEAATWRLMRTWEETRESDVLPSVLLPPRRLPG